MNLNFQNLLEVSLLKYRPNKNYRRKRTKCLFNQTKMHQLFNILLKSKGMYQIQSQYLK